MSDIEKDKFIDDYFEHEGIRLDMDAISVNQGLRRTMKIILNSLWGKFGQRNNMTQSKMCMNPREFYSVILNDELEVTGMFVCPNNNQVLELMYQDKEPYVQESPNTNVYIACFTTCHARLQLYGILDTLQDSVLYYDTDSVIYVRRKHDEPLIELGML